MMGRQTDDQGHLFYDFRLDEAFPTIILCARSPPFWIYRGYTANLRRTIRHSVGRRSTLC